MRETLFHLTDSTQNVPEADRDWEAQLKGDGVICSYCRSILKRDSVDVYLNGTVLKSYAPITFARSSGISMIRKDIMRDMGENTIIDCCYLGKVFDGKGKESENYISFVPKTPPVSLRGDETSGQNECAVCHKLLYFPLPLGKWYVVKDELPPTPFFPSSFAGFLCGEELAKRLRTQGYKKIGYEKIAIRPFSIRVVSK